MFDKPTFLKNNEKRGERANLMRNARFQSLSYYLPVAIFMERQLIL